MAIHCGGRVYQSAEEMIADLRSRATVLERIGYATWYPARRRVTDARRAVKYAYQRVVRGYDDRSLWNLNCYLPKFLGQQLVTMAEIAHGFPPDADYGDVHCIPDNPGENPHFTQWTADLRKHGTALLEFHEHDDDLTGDADAWVALYEPAQDALRWVADHLATLWD